MCTVEEKEKNKKFEYAVFDDNKINDNPTYPLDKIYEKCIEEMTLQQSKRDQIITVYVAMCSFVVSYILSSEMLSFFAKGLVFFAIAIIGLGFSLIITRYRIYKEAYWICCQTITNLMSVKQEEINKETIQGLYYKCLNKKGEKYVNTKTNPKKFRYWTFFKKNIFSGETIYSLIHSFIVSTLIGLSAFMTMAMNSSKEKCIIVAVSMGVVSFIWQEYIYFKNLIEIYSVLVDGKDDSFNKAFSKAWFLHLYIDKEEEKAEQNSESGKA